MAKIPPTRRIIQNGVMGRDLVTVIREETEAVVVATWREAKRPPVVGRLATPRPADPTEPVAPEASTPPVDVTTVETAAYNRGYAMGQAEAASSAEAMIARFEGAIAQLSRGLESTERAATHDSVKLALRIAEKLVRRAMAEDPEALAGAVAAAIEHTSGDEKIVVSCHEDTARGLKMQIDELVHSLGVSQIDITEDPMLAPGDMMLSRGTSTLDARIQTRVGRIERALMRELGLDASEQIEAVG